LRIWEKLKANSRENRQNQTPAENILWQLLRNNQTGYKIRRQHAIDGYIADFVCLPKGLVIEVDGGYHEGTKEEDSIRTEVLNKEGFKVIRFTNEEVTNDAKRVIQIIKETLSSQPDRKVHPFGENLGEASSNSLSFGEGRGEAIHQGSLSKAIFTESANTPADRKNTQSLLFILKIFKNNMLMISMIATQNICPASSPILKPKSPQPMV